MWSSFKIFQVEFLLHETNLLHEMNLLEEFHRKFVKKKKTKLTSAEFIGVLFEANFKKNK